MQELERRFMPCPDLKQQTLLLSKRAAIVVWLDGLVHEDRLQVGVATISEGWIVAPGGGVIKHSRLSIGNTPAVAVAEVAHLEDAIHALFDGKAVMFVDGERHGYAWDVEQFPGRTVQKAENEPTLQGPQESFVENLGLNIPLLRKRLKTPDFKVEILETGTRTRTAVALLYVEGIVKPELVEEARQRMQRIRVDGVLDLNVVREYVTDTPFTLFPTTEETERPERVVGALLQGRVGLFVDGSPNCILVPVTFMVFLSSPEDYYMNYTLALPLRLLRHLMFWSSVLLPALYVALLTYNQDLIPTPLLEKVAAQHIGVPFPTVAEAIVMMLAFEALREAGTRLPRAIGQSVSIVGTLIIGEAAVRAGLVSAGMVIVVAATGIASFTAPALGMVQATRLLQFAFVVSAGMFGMYGVVLLGIALVVHLAGIRSFGVPYLSPIAPTMASDLKDVFLRAPWWAMRKRPRQYEPIDSQRAQGRLLKPRRNRS
ncbi:MAG: spore germination protein [Alicyclobacillus sp.]|nr:spore germination protein [Alicyclobacillus sp.]